VESEAPAKLREKFAGTDQATQADADGTPEARVSP